MFDPSGYSVPPFVYHSARQTRFVQCLLGNTGQQSPPASARPKTALGAVRRTSVSPAPRSRGTRGSNSERAVS